MKLKRLLFAATALFSALAISFNASASNEGCGWYIKRNGNKRPEIDEAQKIIYNYDGYYIDKRHGLSSGFRCLWCPFAGQHNVKSGKLPLPIACLSSYFPYSNNANGKGELSQFPAA